MGLYHVMSLSVRKELFALHFVLYLYIIDFKDDRPKVKNFHIFVVFCLI